MSGGCYLHLRREVRKFQASLGYTVGIQQVCSCVALTAVLFSAQSQTSAISKSSYCLWLLLQPQTCFQPLACLSCLSSPPCLLLHTAPSNCRSLSFYDGSAVKSTGYPSKGPGFNSQHPQGSLHLSEVLVTSSHTGTSRQNTNVLFYLPSKHSVA